MEQSRAALNPIGPSLVVRDWLRDGIALCRGWHGPKARSVLSRGNNSNLDRLGNLFERGAEQSDICCEGKAATAKALDLYHVAIREWNDLLAGPFCWPTCWSNYAFIARAESHPSGQRGC